MCIRDRCTGNFHLDGKLCPANECTCTNGQAVANADCATHGDHHCHSCDASFHAVGKQCKQNVCSCPNGQANTLTACTEHNAEMCVANSCATGYHMETDQSTGYNVCRINVCHCSNGVEKKGTACLIHNDHHCDQCTGNFHLDGKLCPANECTCTNGQAVANADCTVHQRETCKKCNAEHYRLTVGGEVQCLPWKVCTKTQYETTVPNETTNRECKSHTTCTGPSSVDGPGEYESKEAGPSSDRVLSLIHI